MKNWKSRTSTFPLDYNRTQFFNTNLNRKPDSNFLKKNLNSIKTNAFEVFQSTAIEITVAFQNGSFFQCTRNQFDNLNYQIEDYQALSRIVPQGASINGLVVIEK